MTLGLFVLRTSFLHELGTQTIAVVLTLPWGFATCSFCDTGHQTFLAGSSIVTSLFGHSAGSVLVVT